MSAGNPRADGPLRARIRRAPLIHDAGRAAETLGVLPGALRSGAPGELLAGAAGSSPYLAHIIAREAGWLEAVIDAPPEETLRGLVAACDEAACEPRSLGDELRRLKRRLHLLVALADLGGVWDLGMVTGALSDFADAAIGACVRMLLAAEVERGRLPGIDESSVGSGAGYVVLAMGKLGANELNYSSDVDLICLFDQDRFAPADFGQVKARFIHVTRQLVRLLSESTAEGYVFRTDLRLRPAPSTTPVCIAMEAAEHYYESVGRTWERAAYIKARPAAGDLDAGRAFLARLTPFVWRRYLDFAAIEDTYEMLRRIRAQKGRLSVGSLPGTDIKLGPGGIREIEFFAQTRQLICGGRDSRLREPTTLGALAALARAGWVRAETAATLAADYVALRELEHRLQMMEDAQTHRFPTSPEMRDQLAALAGAADREAFEREVGERLARVHGLTEEFYTPHESARAEHAPAAGREDLARLGFDRAAEAYEVLEKWRGGSLPAVRSARARALFDRLEPLIVEKLAASGNPDEALLAFDRFLSGLPAGVQVFSLFVANPHLLDLIIEICAAAPRLAAHLGRHPAALDALLDPGFFDPLPAAPELARELAARIANECGAEGDYEAVLDAARRWAHEQMFRVGVQLLRGKAGAEEAGHAFSAIAEAALNVLYPVVAADFAARHGPPPGRGMVVVAMGKLGSREMTAGSDLDLITIYDADGFEASEGPKPLPTATYYPRLTKALVAALTAPTAEGRLYEVDMRLRPSGRKGPVAVSLGAFVEYQREKAWVWEHMALTRARPVAGPPELAEEARGAIREALARRRGDPRVFVEAREMRARLVEAHARERADPWSLKYAAGGLMEIEFLAQTGILFYGLPARRAAAALPELARTGWIDAEEAEALVAALDLLQTLQQVERVALDHPLDPTRIGEGLRRVLVRATGSESFSALEDRLRRLEARAAAICERVFAAESMPGDPTS